MLGLRCRVQWEMAVFDRKRARRARRCTSWYSARCVGSLGIWPRQRQTRQGRTAGTSYCMLGSPYLLKNRSRLRFFLASLCRCASRLWAGPRMVGQAGASETGAWCARLRIPTHSAGARGYWLPFAAIVCVVRGFHLQPCRASRGYELPISPMVCVVTDFL